MVLPFQLIAVLAIIKYYLVTCIKCVKQTKDDGQVRSFQNKQCSLGDWEFEIMTNCPGFSQNIDHKEIQITSFLKFQ